MERLGIVDELKANRAEFARLAARRWKALRRDTSSEKRPRREHLTPETKAFLADLAVLLAERQAKKRRSEELRIVDLPATKNRRIPKADVTPIEVLEAVSASYAVPIADLISPCRKRHISRARFAACALLQSAARMSYPRIGHILGRRDHTTIMRALVRAKGLHGHNPDWTARYHAAEHLLTSQS